MKEIFNSFSRVLVTGGAGFIGNALVRNLLKKDNIKLCNIDKLGYASNTKSINNFIEQNKLDKSKKYTFHKLDLIDKLNLNQLIEDFKPELIIHLAAESHVDNSINNADEFINSNIIGTYNLLESTRKYWESLPSLKKNSFRFHHVSTDEVFGTAKANEKFNENSIYDPRSPYSASKAASDHLVNSWHNTYGLPTIVTNCSNNYGPWQFPEKFIPVIIKNAINLNKIPIYGKGTNIRDWLFVDDHVEAILLTATKGKNGSRYCIGGNNELENIQLVLEICKILDSEIPNNFKYSDLISFVKDRPGHDARYAIDSTKIKNELGWEPKVNFKEGLKLTVKWYLKNRSWFDVL